jgi:magnesium chelatase family protein
VLFLDELPEFDARATEALRQPLEDRVVTISRVAGTATFPASFALIAARNPCPCGHDGDPVRECTCTAATVNRYNRRVSGPLLDRIDMHVDVPRVDYDKLTDRRASEPSAAVRARVVAARTLQRQRFGVETGSRGRARSIGGPGMSVTCNGEMNAEDVRRFCPISRDSADLLRAGVTRLGLSARAVHRVLKLARTIGDLEACADIRVQHLAEALQLRPRHGT